MIDVGTYPTICDRTDGASRKSKPQSDRLLDECIQQFMQLREAQRHLYENSHRAAVIVGNSIRLASEVELGDALG